MPPATAHEQEEHTIKRILVTGANKGIGLATVTAILEGYPDTSVFLGARNSDLGEQALASLLLEHPQWQARLELLQLDVTSDASVSSARDRVMASVGDDDTPLYAVVNNAGIGLGSADLAAVVAVNTFGVKRVCDAFMPLLQPGGRIVNISSASGPKFVSECHPRRQAFFKDTRLDWSDLHQLIDEVLAGAQRQPASDTPFAALGMGSYNPYGFSKACTTLYTLLLARDHPQWLINACTPGYIETDLTRTQAQQRGVTPSEMGMKPPQAGTVAPLHLLFDDNPGSGRYYGSDAKRSPLDHYRAPGSPEYTGD